MVEVAINGKHLDRAKLDGAATPGYFALQPAGEMDFGNLFVR